MSRPPFDLSGRNALVTGAGRGLGRGIAARLLAAGARVAINDIDADAARDAAETLGSGALALPGDAADEAAVGHLFERFAADVGPIDILVNNAGMVRAEDVFDTDFDSWSRVMAVNLSGPFLCSRAALQAMRGHGLGGRVIMIGSVVGHQGALKGYPHYGASKSGLHGLAKSLARTAAAFGVTVNVVAPGVIETEMLTRSHGEAGVAELAAQVPLGRLGVAEDVAAAVHYLASAEAGYVTGAVLDVNGGLYVRA